MPTEKMYFLIGLALYSGGILFIGFAIGWFRENARTKERWSLWLGLFESVLGCILVTLARIPWGYTPIGAYFGR